jgi:hypothetical protein
VAPVACSVTVPRPQFEPPVIVGALGVVSMVAFTSVRVLSQVPLLMETKYDVVAVMAGVVYVLFTCPDSAVPPVATVYQRYCPLLPPDAVSVNGAAIQLDASIVVGAVGFALTVSVTVFENLSCELSPDSLQRKSSIPTLPDVLMLREVEVAPL